MVKPLIKGFQSFRNDYFDKERQFFKNLTKRGQKPKIMVISCSDSRVDPAILFNTRAGELFVVRNVANLVPPYEPDDGYHGVSAAIEFAVRDLKVKDIVILGHAFCGGITALCNECKNEIEGMQESNENKKEFINSWISISKKTILDLDLTDWPGPSQHIAEKASITNSLNNLMSFPWISKLVSNNDLMLHGWWFDMENASLWSVNQKNYEFEKLIPK